jgi:hypothetical protein
VIRIIDKYLPPFWSRSNPVDLVGTRDTEVPLVAVAELLKCDGIDAVISLGIVGRIDLVRSILETTGRVDPQASPEFLARMEAFARAYEQDYVTRMVSLMETYEKPVVGVTLAQTEQGVVRPVEGKRYGGVFYQTPEDAVRVLAGMVQYQRSVSRSTFGR